MICGLGRPDRIGMLAIDLLEALGGGLVFLLARDHRGRGCRAPRRAARCSWCRRPTSRSRRAPSDARAQRQPGDARREPYLKPLSTCSSVKLLGRRVYITPKRKKRGRAAPQKMRGERQKPASVGLSAQERRNLQVVVISRRLGPLGDVEIDRGLGRRRPGARLGRDGNDVLRRRTRGGRLDGSAALPCGRRRRLGRREGAGNALEQVRRAALAGRPRGNRSRERLAGPHRRPGRRTTDAPVVLVDQRPLRRAAGAGAATGSTAPAARSARAPAAVQPARPATRPARDRGFGSAALRRRRRDRRSAIGPAPAQPGATAIGGADGATAAAPAACDRRHGRRTGAAAMGAGGGDRGGRHGDAADRRRDRAAERRLAGLHRPVHVER